MGYIRTKTIKGNDYLYEQESYRVGNQVRTRHIRYVGKGGNLRGSGLQGSGSTKSKNRIFNNNEIEKEFGYTENPNEAGFITSDGKMLDFSGRNNASGYKNNKPLPNQPDYLAGRRTIDHREIKQFYKGKDKEEKEYQYQYVESYMKETKSIRLGTTPNDKDINISIGNKITPQQKIRINAIYKEKQNVKGERSFGNGKIYLDNDMKKTNDKFVATKTYNNINEFNNDKEVFE